MSVLRNSAAAAALLFCFSVEITSAQTLTDRKAFNIQAQALDSALIEFSKIAGVQVIAATDVVANKHAAGIKETGTVENALHDLLAGTGLTYRAAGGSAVTIIAIGSPQDPSSQKSDVAPAAPAAPSGTATPGDLEAVTVTAERRSEPLGHVPLAVTVFQGSDLEAHGQNSLTDYIGEAPGVSVRPSENGLASVSIRGINSPIDDATVGFYIDDIPFSLSGSTVLPNMQAFDLDRVEVLRGPQGTLYGQGSMGGTIKLITESPDLNDYGAKLDFSTGLKDGGAPDYVANGEVNLPIVDGVLALRLVAGYENSGGFITNTTNGDKDINGSVAQNYRAKILYTPTDKLSITGTVWLQRNFTNFSLDSYSDRTYPSGPGNDFLNVRGDAYNGVIKYELPFAQITSSTSLMDFDLASMNFSTIVSPGATTNVTVTSDSHTRIFAEEVRLVSTDDSPVKWNFGTLYTSVRTPASALVNVSTFVPVPGIIIGTLQDTNAVLDSHTISVYGQASMLFFNGFLEPLIGVRYFQDTQSGYDVNTTTSTVTFTTLPIPPSSTTTTTSDVESGTRYPSVDPRFNIAFHFSDELLAYVNVAEGFRSGTENGAAAVADAKSLGLTIGKVNPDTVWSYEVGSKATLLNGQLALEGALYYNSWKDIQLLPEDPITFVSFVVNGGNAHTEGVELSATYEPVTNWLIQASGNLNQSELDSINPALSGTILGYKAGDELDYTPKQQLNAMSTYTWDLGWGDGLQGYVYAALNYNSAMQHTETTGVFVGGPVTLVNLRAGIQKGNWGVYLYTDNLFNSNAEVTNFGQGLGERPQPRVVGVNLRANF